MKKFLFSAVALIGFTVASYGANTVEVEVKENLLVEVTSDPCSDCYLDFNRNVNVLTMAGLANEKYAIKAIEAIFDDCVAVSCQN